jgi:acetylglutamate/LysW-gamma-L-alpha-aminoadipate kinase
MTPRPGPGTPVVVKCGGSGGVDLIRICGDAAQLHAEGQRIVLVHGGAQAIGGLARRLGVPQRELTGPGGTTRYTDAATLEVVTMALAGEVQPRLVRTLTAAGAPAVGLTGLDGGLLVARAAPVRHRSPAGRVTVVRDNHAGPIVKVDVTVLRTLLDAGFLPVVSPPATGLDGGALNVNADRAAAALAAALGATALVVLTGAPGLLRDPGDEMSVFRRYAIARQGPPPEFATGGMAIKLAAAREALLGGVPEVVVAAGRGFRPVAAALAGGGSRIVLRPAAERPA